MPRYARTLRSILLKLLDGIIEIKNKKKYVYTYGSKRVFKKPK